MMTLTVENRPFHQSCSSPVGQSSGCAPGLVNRAEISLFLDHGLEGGIRFDDFGFRSPGCAGLVILDSQAARYAVECTPTSVSYNDRTE